MKKFRLFTFIFLIFCSVFALASCGGNNTPEDKSEDVEIVKNDTDTHYLKFMENNAEVLRLVVLENETYEDLLPYFPTLTVEEGFIKYWDGDYKYTSYTSDNQFVVYSSTDLVIEIYSYMKKAS